MKSRRLEQEKKKLIEELGVYFEKEKQTPPLAGRIIAMLIVNGEEGTTFEQLVADLKASKSSICTHLNTLEVQQRIKYFTKCGDRKRYYKMAEGYLSRKIQFLLSQWQEEMMLQHKVVAYKELFNKSKPKESLSPSSHKDAIKFLNASIKFMSNQAKKYQSKEKELNL